MRLSSSAKTNSVTTLTSAIWNASDSEENNHRHPPLLQGTSNSHYYLLPHIPLEADREDPLFSELFEGILIK